MLMAGLALGNPVLTYILRPNSVRRVRTLMAAPASVTIQNPLAAIMLISTGFSAVVTTELTMVAGGLICLLICLTSQMKKTQLYRRYQGHYRGTAPRPVLAGAWTLITSTRQVTSESVRSWLSSSFGQRLLNNHVQPDSTPNPTAIG